MTICPFMSGVFQNGQHQVAHCQSNCALKIGDDCSFKILGVEALKNLNTPDTSNSAKKPNKD